MIILSNEEELRLLRVLYYVKELKKAADKEGSDCPCFRLNDKSRCISSYVEINILNPLKELLDFDFDKNKEIKLIKIKNDRATLDIEIVALSKKLAKELGEIEAPLSD